MIRELFEEMPIISSITALLLLLGVLIMLDGITSKPEYYSGSVIDKHYVARSHKTGTGVGMTGKGQSGVIITSQTEAEKFLLMAKAPNGKIFTVNCKAELYYKKEIGHELDFAVYKGGIVGMDWSIRGLK